MSEGNGEDVKGLSMFMRRFGDMIQTFGVAAIIGLFTVVWYQGIGAETRTKDIASLQEQNDRLIKIVERQADKMEQVLIKMSAIEWNQQRIIELDKRIRELERGTLGRTPMENGGK